MAARHKAALAIGVAAMVAVIAASATALWQRQVAVREQQRAELLFRDGRQLANALIFKVHDAVAQLPGSTEVRKTIVHDAVAYLERLEAQSGGNPAMRLELANAFGQIAGILGDPQKANLGDRNGAVAQYQKSQALAKGLLASGPPTYEVIEAYARAGQRLSTIAGLQGDPAAAVAVAQDAVDRVTQYTELHPADPRGPKLLAESNFYLAWSLPDAESVEAWERAMAYYDAELAKDPANAAHQRNASLMRKYLSSTLMELGRREQAEPHFRRALELDELRLAVAPEDRQTRLDAAISSGQMGEFFERTGNRAEAAELYARSVVLRRQAVESDPKDVMARERLSHGLMTLGRVRGRLGNAAEARVLLHEAIAVEEEVIKVTRDLSSRAQLAHLWSEIAAVEEGAGQTPAACRAYRRAQEQFIAAQAALTDANKVRLATVRSKISECSALND